MGAKATRLPASELVFGLGTSWTASFDDFCSGNVDGCVELPTGEEVPEPSTGLLMASGLALAAWRRRFA